MAVENNPADNQEKHPLAGTGEDITPNKDEGVLKAIIKEGDTTEEDRPMKGDNVFVHYVGTLMNGEEFDSSRRRGEKFSFKLGEGQVIKAWDMGVATMRRGEVAVLTCQSEYAYGKKGQGKIPADATLVFEVELFDWAGEDLTEDKDGGIIRRVISEGSGTESPSEDSSIDLHVVGKHDGTTFDERDVSFLLGAGDEHNIPIGVEKGLEKMVNGETSEFRIQPKYGFGSEGCSALNVPPNATLKYRVTLKKLIKAKESWEMDAAEKLATAETAKAKGTEYFKAGNYKGAIKQYKKVVDLLDLDSEFTSEDKASSKEVLLAGQLNLSMAYIKNQNYAEAVDSCNRALSMDPNNIKGLFRRGQANLAMSDPKSAKDDFRRVTELEPENKAARNQLTICLHKIKQESDKEKRLYGNMFAKFAEQDRKAEAEKTVRTLPPEEFGAVFNKDEVQATNADESEEKEQSETPDAPNSDDAPSETKTDAMEVEV